VSCLTVESAVVTTDEGPSGAHLVDKGTNVGDFPCFADLAVADMADDRLIHTKGSACSRHAAEGTAERPGDDHTRHFDASVGYDFLDFVVDVGHRRYSVAPDLFL
jgi:hypothetical protein